MATILEQIREAVLDNRHEFSRHAVRELALDRLLAVDAESAILTGEVIRTEPDEMENPGPRYTVVGHATDLHTRLAVVCRFVPHSTRQFLLIVTCYEITS